MKRPTHDWVAIAPCGCVDSVMYDTGTKSDDQAIAEWARQGYRIAHMPIHDAVALLEKPCIHRPAPTAPAGEPLSSGSRVATDRGASGNPAAGLGS